MAAWTNAIATAAGATVAGLAMATYGMVAAGSQIFGKTLVAPQLPRQLALTFDDGPNPGATPQLLEVLSRHGVRATFFLIGNHVLQQPALTRAISAAGHVIGNHTMSHPYLPRLGAASIGRQLAECNDVLEQTLGLTVDLFRPPHGARSPAVIRAARLLGLTTVQWNVIVSDWKQPPATTLLDRLERGVAHNQARGRGTNIVLHDGGQAGLQPPRLKTVEAVEMFLDRLPDETLFVTPYDFAG